ncbi:MAG: hypothetical protein M3137_06435 [Actinomycetota bacterium]|nr:hypothetical protein [Actinomycetota bacterium]
MRRSTALGAIWLFVLLSPIATWSIAGDMSYKGDPHPDYMFRPLPLTGGQELAIAAAALTVSAAAAVFVALAYRRRLVGRADLRLALPLLLVGAYCGIAWRMMTAAVIGANIGGAMAMMFAVVFLPAMIIWFGAELWRFRSTGGSDRRSERRWGSPPVSGHDQPSPRAAWYESAREPSA